MTLQPNEGSGPEFVSIQVISYSEAVHSDLQLSDPPVTPPSAMFTVVPFVTSQICLGRPAEHPGPDGDEFTSTFAG
jgi:hypothetical protein